MEWAKSLRVLEIPFPYSFTPGTVNFTDRSASYNGFTIDYYTNCIITVEKVEREQKLRLLQPFRVGLYDRPPISKPPDTFEVFVPGLDELHINGCTVLFKLIERPLS